MFRITLERERRGLSKSKLARLAGIHPSHLSQLESGKTYPWPGWVQRLSDALGVPGEYLFEEVDDDEIETAIAELQRAALERQLRANKTR